MLIWHRKLWLIDHGAALYFHHSWTNMDQRSKDPFSLVKEHILLPFAGSMEIADADLSFLEARIKLNESRLLGLDPSVDVVMVRQHLATIPTICRGGEDAGSIGQLPQLNAVTGSSPRAAPLFKPLQFTPAGATTRPQRWNI